ncbi:hypothetical protein NPIL_425081 [Nephila pilipes]|uniref:Uncharacterized protein n=1 Tax=Nephila pilipes TaxID=299642 RepID=A0A8X6MTQ9_NEPPI|nr:hypothetical protein NPIL_425081 [Nephila pilipes]
MDMEVNSYSEERNLASPLTASKKSKREDFSELDNDSESLKSAPPSESEKETNEKVILPPTPVQSEAHESGGRGEENDGFTIVTNKKKRVPPIYIDECLNTPDLLKDISEKTKSKILGRIVKGKLKVFPEIPNEHRIIQNFISVKKLRSHTFEMQMKKNVKSSNSRSPC